MTARIDSPTTHAAGEERPRTAPVERARDGDVRALHSTPLPLTGVRVLDLGHVFQGPYATFLMAMAGAEVIKIEPPRGDMMRKRARDGDYPFRALNGCKRSIVLNLKTARGRELLLELSRTADVLVENFAPSVMPRLGLGPDAFLQVNPRLIYASASGFGRTGPYADKLALDLTIQAMSGLMSTTGEQGGRPLKAGVPVADFMSGAHLYGAIVTALYERERTGRGRVLEVSMLESLFATLLPAAGHVYASNTVPQRTGNRHVADSYVPFDTFETADGWMAIVCATDEHWANLTEAMGRPDLRDSEELRRLPGRVARIDDSDGGGRGLDGDTHAQRDQRAVRPVPRARRAVTRSDGGPRRPAPARARLSDGSRHRRRAGGVAEQSDALRGIGPEAADVLTIARAAYRRGADRTLWPRRGRARRPSS